MIDALRELKYWAFLKFHGKLVQLRVKEKQEEFDKQSKPKEKQKKKKKTISLNPSRVSLSSSIDKLVIYIDNSCTILHHVKLKAIASQCFPKVTQMVQKVVDSYYEVNQFLISFDCIFFSKKYSYTWLWP